MKTIFTAASVAALALVAAPASAQMASPSWTGPYIGIFGGATQANDQENERLVFDRNLDGNFVDAVTTPAGADAFAPGFCDGDARGPAAPAGCDGDYQGVQAGVRAGYDMQFGNFVLGGVADFGMVNQQDAVTGFSSTPASYTFNRELERLAAARLRAGFAFDRALIYGTGGYAYGKIRNTFYTSNTANSFTATVDDRWEDGWQAGGGVEYRLTPTLSVTGEYLYTSLNAPDYVIRVGRGTAPATNPFVLAPNTTGTDMMRSNGRFGAHAVNLGMNLRF